MRLLLCRLGASGRTMGNGRGRLLSTIPDFKKHHDSSAMSTLPTETVQGGTASAQIKIRDLMNRSPIRKCIITKQYLPSDYMIRFSPTSEEADHTTPVSPSFSHRLSLVPRTATSRRPEPLAGLQSRKSMWVSCRREAVDALSRPGPHIGILRQTPGLAVPSNITDLVEQQLQERVIWELGRVSCGVVGLVEVDGSGNLKNALDTEGVGIPDSWGNTLAIIDTSEQQDLPNDTLQSAHGSLFFELRKLFPSSVVPSVQAALELSLHQTSSITSQRPTESSQSDSSTRLVAVYDQSGKSGLKAWPLVRALLRLRMWSGEGWTEP